MTIAAWRRRVRGTRSVQRDDRLDALPSAAAPRPHGEAGTEARRAGRRLPPIHGETAAVQVSGQRVTAELEESAARVANPNVSAADVVPLPDERESGVDSECST